MNKNRRQFLKYSSLAGIGLAGRVGMGARKNEPENPFANFREEKAPPFNMCGYAAPPLEKVRIGFIGLGNRGSAAVERISFIEGVEIRALCDIRTEKTDAALKSLEKTSFHPKIFTHKEEEWKKLCDLPDIDLVYIATPWSLHTPMAVYAMKQGKHVCVEVPAAKTIDECWQLVETSENTRKHCMILENVCYDFFELLTLNLARQGFFGEIVHCDGAYIHDLLEGNFSKTKYYDQWRLKENFRNGNLYPTHGLGPLAQIMNLNRGDKMNLLISMQSDDFSMEKMANELASKDEFYNPYANKHFRGNMNTTTIRTEKGRTIMLQHDVSSPNIYSRIFKISGTKGSALKYPLPGKLALGHEEWFTDEQIKEVETKYQPPLVKLIGEKAKEVGGHGGMDFLMDWRTMDCLRNGLPLDIDVYDAASWSAIAPLSEWSVSHHSSPIQVPDFTRGAWKTNKPVDPSHVESPERAADKKSVDRGS